MNTRLVTVTAVRTYISQHTVEIPAFCSPERFRAFVAHGGSISRFLSDRMTFEFVAGTGIESPHVSPAKDGARPDTTLADIAAHLREDGLQF